MSLTAQVPSSSATPTGRVGTPPRWVGAIVGIVAAAAGLGVAELVAAASTSLRSPLISVGDRVIDLVPASVKDWAISVFGTGDKAALLIGTSVLLAAYTVVVGIVAVRRSVPLALVGIALFALVGVTASLGRGGGGWAAPLPSVIGGIVAGAVLAYLARRARTAWAPPPERDPVSMDALVASSRRRFLATAAGIGAAAVAAGGVGRWLTDRAAVTAERLHIRLPVATKPLAPVPEGVSVGLEGVSPFITPNDDFYRIDTALIVPSVTVDDWDLTVKGMVGRPVTLTYDELLARPMIEADVTIACVSNDVGGDLVGNARWLGCRLDDLLAEAGVDPRADQVVGRSVDGFTAGFPTAVLDGREALVAVGMNGEVLPTEHGFPARLIVPGIYGYVSATKWLSEIELTRFDEFEGYWIPRGWSVEAPVKTQSRIDVPRPGATVTAGRRLGVGGVAWAPVRGITKVEVQVDDGPWNEAVLGDPYAATAWRLWRYEFIPNEGEHRIRVRASDGSGETQTGEQAPPEPDGATGWHTVIVEAS